MRTLNPDTVLRVFLCDLRKIGAAERVAEVGEGADAALSLEMGGKKKASWRVGAPNRVEGRTMLSSLNVGTSGTGEHQEIRADGIVWPTRSDGAQEVHLLQPACQLAGRIPTVVRTRDG